MACVGFSQTVNFEGFEGITSRISGVTPSALYGRNGGKGIGINGLGYMLGTGWAVGGAAPAYALTVAFAFKNWKDKVWSGSVTLCELYGLGGGLKASLAITAQKQLVISSYDRWLGDMVLRDISQERLADDAWHYIALHWVSGGSGALGTCNCDGFSAGSGHVSAYIGGRQVASFDDSSDLCPEDNPPDPESVMDEDGCWTNPDPTNDLTGVRGFRIGVLGGFLNEERHMGFDDVMTGVGAISDAAMMELTLNEVVVNELTPVPGPTNLEMINDDPPDDADGYNMTDNVFHKTDRWTVEPVADTSGCPLAVQLDARMRKTSTASWRAQLYVWVAGEEWPEYHFDRVLHYDPEAGSFFNQPLASFVQAPGPPDEDGYTIGSDWSWEKINSLEVGYVLFSPGVSLGTTIEALRPIQSVEPF
jgi:hypothetical protein